MKKFEVTVSQNGWEYTGRVYVQCNEIAKVSDRAILADGVEVEFDEEVGSITEIDLSDTLEI